MFFDDRMLSESDREIQKINMQQEYDFLVWTILRTESEAEHALV